MLTVISSFTEETKVISRESILFISLPKHPLWKSKFTSKALFFYFAYPVLMLKNSSGVLTYYPETFLHPLANLSSVSSSHTFKCSKIFYFIYNLLGVRNKRWANKYICSTMYFKIVINHMNILELPWWSSGLESAFQCKGLGLDPWSRKLDPMCCMATKSIHSCWAFRF